MHQSSCAHKKWPRLTPHNRYFSWFNMMVEPLGLEPKTSSMPWKRSSQLNYDPLPQTYLFGFLLSRWVKYPCLYPIFVYFQRQAHYSCCYWHSFGFLQFLEDIACVYLNPLVCQLFNQIWCLLVCAFFWHIFTERL